jgi:hypothetical protein
MNWKVVFILIVSIGLEYIVAFVENKEPSFNGYMACVFGMLIAYAFIPEKRDKND